MTTVNAVNTIDATSYFLFGAWTDIIVSHQCELFVLIAPMLHCLYCYRRQMFSVVVREVAVTLEFEMVWIMTLKQ